MKQLNSLLLAGALVLLLGLFSCSGSSENTTGTLTGQVVLNNDTGNAALDPADFAGISVAVYAPVVLDTTLVRLNAKYPTLGFAVSQTTEFDHRLGTPVASTATDAEGNWSIGGISPGKYNVVIRKSGWGYRYFTDFTVTEGETAVQDEGGKAAVSLYPDKVISGYYEQGSYTFDNKHQVVIHNDTSFLAGTSVVVQPGTVVRIDPNVSLYFYGSVKIQGSATSMIRFTSNDGWDLGGSGTVQPFEKIVFNQGASLVNGQITYTDINDVSSGVFCNSVATEMVSCRIKGIDGAFTGNSNPSLNWTNCIFTLGAVSANYTVISSTQTSSVMEKCIIYNTEYGFYTTANNNLTIKNSYFNCNQKCIFLNQYVNAVVNHNEIVSPKMGIHTYWGVTSSITYNNVICDVGLVYRSYENMGVANYNNLLCSHWGIDFVTNSPNLGNLPAANNWWGTADDEDIQGLINDKSDYTPTTQFYDSFSYVTYLPFRTSKLGNAGIQ